MMSVKKGSIKYYFLSLWYDSTWDWTPVSRTIGEHYTLKEGVTLQTPTMCEYILEKI